MVHVACRPTCGFARRRRAMHGSSSDMRGRAGRVVHGRVGRAGCRRVGRAAWVRWALGVLGVRALGVLVMQALGVRALSRVSCVGALGGLGVSCRAGCVGRVAWARWASGVLGVRIRRAGDGCAGIWRARAEHVACGGLGVPRVVALAASRVWRAGRGCIGRAAWACRASDAQGVRRAGCARAELVACGRVGRAGCGCAECAACGHAGLVVCGHSGMGVGVSRDSSAGTAAGVH